MQDFDLTDFSLIHNEAKPYEILKEKRLILRMTQQDVADKAKITLSQYQKFEGGQRNIRTASFQLACRVIEALGMNINDFYHEEYILGEEIRFEPDGLHYAKTGENVEKDF